MAARAVPQRPRPLERASVSPWRNAGRRQGPAPLALGVYGALCAATLGAAWLADRSPVDMAPAIELPPWARAPVSIAAGLALAFATVRATRVLVKRFAWVRALSRDLRPSVRGAGDGTLLLLGAASGVAEELFFRGLLVPALGIVVPAIAFGALHRLRGPAGLVWSVWAAVMGLLFGGVFVVTGNLLGAICAHVVINVVNLRFVRDFDETPPPPKLGGLLGRPSRAPLEHVDPVVDRSRDLVR